MKYYIKYVSFFKDHFISSKASEAALIQVELGTSRRCLIGALILFLADLVRYVTETQANTHMQILGRRRAIGSQDRTGHHLCCNVLPMEVDTS